MGHLKKLISTCCLLAATLVSGASTPVNGDEGLRWSSLVYDFGSFHEEAGQKTGSVSFVNVSNEPTVIGYVRPSCGCTGADYTRGTIAPGDSATISFTYNPAGRPGSFEKTVKVYTGTDNKRSVIVIKGTVIGAPASLKKDYPVVAGPLRMSQQSVDAGKVAADGARHSFVKLYNQSDSVISPVVSVSDKALDVMIAPECIQPGEIATMSLYLKPRITDKRGPVCFEVNVRPQTESDDKMTLLYKADIVAPAQIINKNSVKTSE